MIFLLAILTSSGLLKLKAQTPPIIDENWELNSTLSDDFNSLDLSKWHKCYCLADDWGSGSGCWGEGGMHYSHAYVENGILKLKVDTLINSYTPTGDLWAAGIYTNNFEYSYGYYEIRAKLPGYYNNGESCGQGFWPCFWTYNTDPGIHREIDILEPSGTQYADGRTNVSGWWTNQITGTGQEPLKYGEYWFTSSTPLFSNYHKFGLEWLPNRIVLYFDDKPYFIAMNDETVPNDADIHKHRVVIDQQLSSFINANTPFPQYMEVDYFRYYELNDSYCGQNATILNTSQLNSFSYGVRQNITIGNGSSSISLSSGDNKTFRATNEIIINGDFTVPLGSGLNLIPTPCN